MKAIITGANGTVGKALTLHLATKGWTVVPWNRAETAIDEYSLMEEFIKEQEPDVVYHLAVASKPTGRENESWIVNYHWPSELAWICRQHGIKMVYTSSVMVYTSNNPGPYRLDTPADEEEGYGREKRQTEERLMHQNPNVSIVRLGWQIGNGPGSNNMLDFLHHQHLENGNIKASSEWLPACSFLMDTCDGLMKAATFDDGGLFLLDSNRGWSFFEIVEALARQRAESWQVQKTDDFIYDQRMIDPRLGTKPLSDHLKALRNIT